MAVEMFRVVLTPKGAEAEKAAEEQIIVDLKVDPETGATAGPLPAFGRVGNFTNPGALYPFTLMVDGRMDYGAHASADERQDNLSVRSAKIEVGEEVSYKDASGEFTYVIKSVTAHSA
jgi:hypothetical protein